MLPLPKNRFGYKGENMSEQLQALLNLETVSCRGNFSRCETGQRFPDRKG